MEIWMIGYQLKLLKKLESNEVQNSTAPHMDFCFVRQLELEELFLTLENETSLENLTVGSPNISNNEIWNKHAHNLFFVFFFRFALVIFLFRAKRAR
jgi:hypothetical protein